MANSKDFADKQTNKQTEKLTAKKLYAPDLSMWGHRNVAQITGKKNERVEDMV